LVLAGLWLLDGVLQFQPYMYTKSFSMTTLTPVVGDNPEWVAGPMRTLNSVVAAHPVSVNTVFALIQVALGLGIAYRPTLRLALASSIAWSFGVWWLGEGFGGLFVGTANPLTGAPGSVMLYALAAVLLWPSEKVAPFQAAAWIGERAARAAWSAVWGLLAVPCCPQPTARRTGCMTRSQTPRAVLQPAWCGWTTEWRRRRQAGARPS
jgi:hypothetical protein